MALAAIVGFFVVVGFPLGAPSCPRFQSLVQETPAEPSSQQNPTPPPPDVTPSQPPAQSRQPQSGTPKPAPEQNQSSPSSPSGASPAQESGAQAQPTKKIATTHGKKRRHKRGASAAKPGSAPEKRVVRNGSTSEPVIQLSPTASDGEASSQRQNTGQLLATADANLQKVSGRQLNMTQQDVVSQIRKYMEQAKEAESAGDLQRAQNLAVKAHLLSEDLIRQ
jgi:hypothetical protein